jgi:uncharacterized membrane protein YgcG
MELHDKKEYSAKAMLALAATIRKDEEAFNWLLENDNKELAALADVLVYGQQDALEWLKTNHFNQLVSFVGALEEDEDSINYLMMNDGKKWAATAEMVNGSETAPDWLQKFYPSYGAFAEALISNSGRSGGIGIGGYGGGGGGGGFGGFGGGSFSGGGGGGRW